MPQPVQLVQFDAEEREVLLAAGQPKEIDRAVRAAAARIKQQLKGVMELASDKTVGASREGLSAARAGLEQSLKLLEVCPVGEAADLIKEQQRALSLIDEALQLSTGMSAEG